MSIQENYHKIKAQIPENVELVAVSKFHSIEKIKEVYDCGQKVFGENKVQELLTKVNELPADIQWHLIGHLQTNKVKYIAPFIDTIQSVDSEKLLLEINKEAAKNNRIIKVLLQVKIAEEETKYGLEIAEAKEIFSNYLEHQYPNIEILGLMGMATFTDNKNQVKSEFLVLKSLFDEHITNKIESIRNPVFFHEITNVVKENTVSFVSRLERKHKNAFLIVKTWELLHRSFHDWTLKIYGEGSLRPKMENFIKEKQIKNVEFMGFSKDMNQEFAKSSITVSTSDCEGYPMVVAEAIASKNAIATTRSDGGIWDMIIENKTGLVSDRNRADLLANNIAKLIQNNTLRNQLINNSYEHLTGIVNDDVFIKWKKFLQKKL